MEYEGTRADKMRRLADRKIEQKDSEALLFLLQSEEGRWFLMRLFERCHLTGGSAFPEGDVHRLLIMEGERRVGLHIQNLIAANMGTLAEKQRAESEYYALMNDLKAMIASAEREEETE